MEQHFVIKSALDSATLKDFQTQLSKIKFDGTMFDLYPTPGPNQKKDAEHIEIGTSKESEISQNNLNSIWQSINKIVTEKLGTIYPTYGVFNESVTPMVEHVDAIPTQRDYNLKPAYTLILPLESDVKCHTVVWNVTSEYPVKFQDQKIVGSTDYQHTEEDKKLLSHCDKKVFGWGKPYFYEWIAGDIICIKRDHVHASDNFMVDNAGATKKSILLLTRFDYS